MSHLSDTRLNAHIFDGANLTPEERTHLELCADCRVQVAAAQLLRDELQIARSSQPALAQLQRYAASFEEIPQQSAGDRLSGWLERVRLALALDSRQAAPALGLRRAAGFGHRLLYSSELVDVELLLEPEGERWQMEGEILPVEPDTISPPYLVEVLGETADISGIRPTHSAESDANGRFRLVEVLPGRYSVVLTPSDGPTVEIRTLQIP